MYWLKLTSFCLPLLGYIAIVYGAVLSIDLEVKVIIAAMGFLLGGLVAASFHELENWWKDLSSTYGSATFATAREVKQAGLYGKDGVPLGRHGRRLLRFNEPGHVCVTAPTRTGKTSCSVVPAVLDYTRGSIVCVDIKREAYDITSRFRRSIGPVFRFAPYDEDSHCFNPFDFLRDGDDLWEDCAKLADALVTPSGEAKAIFFESEARSLLTGVCLFIATEAPAERRNLAEVRRFVTMGGEALKDQLDIMQEARHPLVRRWAGSFAGKEPKLQSNILATVQSHTLIFDSERVARITSKSDFSLEWLKDSVMTLYLVVPPERLSVYRPLIRLMLGMAVDTMTRPTVDRPHDPNWRHLEQSRDWAALERRATWWEAVASWWNGPEERNDVLFLVDEFPSLGFMRALAPDGIAYLAGYGAKLAFYTQSIGQIKSVYGEHVTQAILANCNLQFFGNTDNETLEAVSKMLGNETVRIHQKSKTRHSWLLPDYDHFNVGAAETGRPLLTPDEIRCLGDDRQLLFLKGLRPILARKAPYYKERRWQGLWDKWRGGRSNG